MSDQPKEKFALILRNDSQITVKEIAEFEMSPAHALELLTIPTGKVSEVGEAISKLDFSEVEKTDHLGMARVAFAFTHGQMEVSTLKKYLKVAFEAQYTFENKTGKKSADGLARSVANKYLDLKDSIEGMAHDVAKAKGQKLGKVTFGANCTTYKYYTPYDKQVSAADQRREDALRFMEEQRRTRMLNEQLDTLRKAIGEEKFAELLQAQAETETESAE